MRFGRDPVDWVFAVCLAGVLIVGAWFAWEMHQRNVALDLIGQGLRNK